MIDTAPSPNLLKGTDERFTVNLWDKKIVTETMIKNIETCLRFVDAPFPAKMSANQLRPSLWIIDCLFSICMVYLQGLDCVQLFRLLENPSALYDLFVVFFRALPYPRPELIPGLSL